jgi:microcystin degradation protein MlrC
VVTVGQNSKPVMAKFDCRMIEVLPTSTQPMRGFAERMMAMEAHSELSGLSEIKSHIPGDPEILSVSCIHGFMAADVECMGSAMLVITDNQPEKGAGLAQKLGMELFELRGTTRPEYLHPQAGIDRAVAADKTPKPGFKGNKMPAVIADVWVSHVCNVIGRAATFACRAVNRHIER